MEKAKIILLKASGSEEFPKDFQKKYNQLLKNWIYKMR